MTRPLGSSKLDFGQFSLLGNGALQVFLMPAGIFARSRARPGPTKFGVPLYSGTFRASASSKIGQSQAKRGTYVLDMVVKGFV
jgi:hypothetical protein